MTPLETIERLSSEQYSVLASTSDESGVTQVREAAGFRWLINGGHAVQSLMSLDSPATLLLPNHVAMLFGLLLIDAVDSVLSLGMGGGSLERFLHKQFPQCGILSVEPDHTIVKFAQEFFGIPASVRIESSSAEDFVRTTEQRFDLILCDIFEQENHPACLIRESFYQDLKTALNPGGALALNATPQSDAEMLTILQALRGSFAQVYIAAIDSRGNAIVVAKNGNAPTTEALRVGADHVSNSADVPLTGWIDKFKLIPPP